MINALLRNNVSLVAYDRGDDVMVLITGVPSFKERWFSRHTYESESFEHAAKRVLKALSDELKSPICDEHKLGVMQ